MATWKKWACGILNSVIILVLCGCMMGRQTTGQNAVSLPPTVKPAVLPVSAENLGVIDALSILREQVSALTAESFNSASQWNEQKQSILDGIAIVSNKSAGGDYEAAVALLSTRVEDVIKRSVTGDSLDKLNKLAGVVHDCIGNARKTTIEIRSGKMAGAAGYLDSWTWKGIPYARPPVGELRWRAPADPLPWEGVRHSSDSYDISVQKAQSRMWVQTGGFVGSEDCLYLNIWRPKSDEKGLPVYFWIHGGGNNFGSGKLYDGSVLACQSNVVVVTIQYRLGVMGWFNHPALKNGVTAEEQSGNFGTLDTIKALQWVHDNIGAFGGDPGNVTVAGESAGCHNTINLIISPLSSGLFHRAICESGGLQLATVEEGIEQANRTLIKLLIDDKTARDENEVAACITKMTEAQIAGYLRSKSATDLIRMQAGERIKSVFRPAYIDGVVIPGRWLDVIDSGKYNHVPVIIGSNEYELKPFMPLLGGQIPTTSGRRWSDLYQVLNGQLKLEEVLASQMDRELYEACGYYGSRYWKANNVDSIARKLREQQTEVWAYFFKWGGVGSGPAPYDFIVGAGHATEIPFFFGWPRDTFGFAFTPDNAAGRQALQKAVMTYAAQFARTGDPNRGEGGLIRWESWSNEPGCPKCIVLDATFGEVRVSMMAEEVTADGVRAEVDALPLLIRNVVKLWIQ